MIGLKPCVRLLSCPARDAHHAGFQLGPYVIEAALGAGGMGEVELTRLSNPAPVRSFDITPDGKRIVFDRSRENSDIALINRAAAR